MKGLNAQVMSATAFDTNSSLLMSSRISCSTSAALSTCFCTAAHAGPAQRAT